MPGQVNWNLSKVKSLIRKEKDAQTIMDETGIKIGSLRAIASEMSQKDRQFYRIKGLFEDSAYPRF